MSARRLVGWDRGLADRNADDWCGKIDEVINIGGTAGAMYSF